MKILITGISGFLGSRLAHWILQNTEHHICGIDDLSTGYLENCPKIGKRVMIYTASVCDQERMEYIFNKEKPSACFHLASYASEGRSNHIRSFIHQNNTAGTANVINQCINHNTKLIFTSSVAVYSGQAPFTEEIKPNPIDTYGLSKWCSEQDIQIAGKEHGLDWMILRPRNCYGVGQSIFDPSRNLFGIMCYNSINNIPIQIFGDGKHKRQFTYIDDILKPMYNAIDLNHEIINIGSGIAYTINDAAKAFAKVTGYKNIVHVEERPEVPFAFCDTKKCEEMLGYKDQTPLYVGIEKMWEWAKTLRMRDRIIPPELEVTKNAHISLL